LAVGLVEGKQGSKGGTFLAHGSEGIMREIFGDIIEKIPMKLTVLPSPESLPYTNLNKYSEDTKL
jgi:DNA-binding IscR family transcriptional regulator